MKWAHFDRQAWPVPDAGIGDLEHTLRYGTPTQSELYAAAGVIAAYAALVNGSAHRRVIVVRNLRKAMKEAKP